VSELAGEHDILHIASHSTADDERPWLSALELGASRVRAVELSAASIPAKLAVLSSCQSQHGRVLSGEGVLGLSTALLCAGSDCVVATLWPVEDRATSAFMRAFYEGLESGRTVAGALQRAQASLRADRATAHPFYWSGFVAIGRGEITIPLRERARVWPLPVAAGAAFLVVALFWRRSRNRPRPVIGTPRERLMG
jgi:CHAT domain-containing protein